MSNILEKPFNMGLGLFAYSREKIEKVVDELVNKGEVTRKDAQEVVSDLVKKGEEQREELKKFVRDEIKETVDLKDFVKTGDLRDIIREELAKVISYEGIATKEDINNLSEKLDLK